MKSRAFNKRITFYLHGLTDDGVGGVVAATPIQLFKTWAKMSSFKVGNSYQSTDTNLGLNNFQNAVVVTVRNREGFRFESNMFFEYRGNDYTIHTAPTNEDFKDAYIQFIAVKQYKDPLQQADNNLAVELNHQL